MEQTTEHIDDLIGQVERFYRSLTGQDAPPTREMPYAPIPPERDPERHLAEQVDRLLVSLGQLSPEAPLTTPGWTPPMTLLETRAELWICLDMPGVSSDAIQIRVSRRMLEVSGERRPPRFDGEARCLYDESPRGPFRRMVPLPLHAAVEHIEARLREGALEIRLPRISAPEAEVRTISVN
jgi:HSP20 family protein